MQKKKLQLLLWEEKYNESKGGQKHRGLGGSEQLNCDLSKEIRDGEKQTIADTWSAITQVQTKITSNICQYERMQCG